MSSLTSTFAKRAAIALLASTSLAGCLSMPTSMSPYQGRQIGQGVGTMVGAAVGSRLSSSSNPWAQAAGAAVGGWSMREIGGALFEAAAQTAGQCNQTASATNGVVTGSSSSCGRTTAYPGSVPYPR